MLDQAAMTGAYVDSTGTIELQDFADQLNLSRTYPIRVTLVKSDIVNAYALPGGNIVVYSGILKKIKTPEELAALLSHESTHVNERHSLKSLLRSAANGLIVSILLSDASGITGTLVSNAQTLNGLSYSRSLEKEADQKGMELLLANGVDLEGMRDLMRTLEAEGDVPGSISFLSSHPLTKERIQAATKFIKDHPQSIEEREDLKEQFEKLHSLPVISEE
jgi:predicted Zn-dependent protease